MDRHQIVSLRSHLIGSLNDIVEAANLGQLGKCSIVSELVSQIVDYEEEGTSLLLDIFLTDDLDKLTRTIPHSAFITLGKAPCDESGIKRALKCTAPLVRGCWKMFFTTRGDEIEFGLFRDSGHPLNVPIHVAMQADVNSDAKFIRITKLAHDTVRTITHTGKSLDIQFSNERRSESGEVRAEISLCEQLCSGLESKLSQSCKTYLESFFGPILKLSVGTVVVVVDKPKVPRFLSDCTRFSPVLSISDAVQAVLKDLQNLPQLHAIESLVHGAFCCDGIVIFDTQANLVAYNAFVRLKPSSTSGGARRRAYDALCNKLGKSMVAVFYQSQDGESDIRSRAK